MSDIKPGDRFNIRANAKCEKLPRHGLLRERRINHELVVRAYGDSLGCDGLKRAVKVKTENAKCGTLFNFWAYPEWLIPVDCLYSNNDEDQESELHQKELKRVRAEARDETEHSWAERDRKWAERDGEKDRKIANLKSEIANLQVVLNDTKKVVTNLREEKADLAMIESDLDNSMIMDLPKAVHEMAKVSHLVQESSDTLNLLAQAEKDRQVEIVKQHCQAHAQTIVHTAAAQCVGHRSKASIAISSFYCAAFQTLVRWFFPALAVILSAYFLS